MRVDRPGLREGPVDVQAALLLNHRELPGFIHGMGCQDVAERRPASISMKLGRVLPDRVFAKTLQTRPPCRTPAARELNRVSRE